MSTFALLFAMLGILPVQAGDRSNPEQQISLELRDTYLKNVLWAIEQQTSFKFMYNQEDLDRVGKVNVVARGVNVEQILTEVLRGTGLTYSIREGAIILKQEAQQPARYVVVSGKVSDERKRPLAGVTVSIKGVPTGTVTDVNGAYRIVVPAASNPVLAFSFVGMEKQEIACTGQTQIDVVMKEVATQVDAVFVVHTGYQTLDPRESASAIQVINAEKIKTPGLLTIDQMLEGYVPGMVYMQNSGQIGTTPRLRIRGTSTVLGSQEPVWVVDGVVQDNPVDIDPSQINDLDFVNLVGNAISGLNPDDIELISILKDASATALYGAKAANGVILITTKQGRQGPPSISYSMSGTFMRRPHYSDASVNMMNSRERIDFSRDLLENRVVYPHVDNWLGYEKAMIDYYQGRITYAQMQREVGYYESVNTDWFDVLMQNSFSTKHTLSLSGGNLNIRYYTSVGMDNAKGSIRGEKNDRYTAALNLNGNYKRLSFRFSINANTGTKIYTPGDVAVTRYAYETTRALPAYNGDGSLWYYPMQVESGTYRDYNIINEVRNASQEIRQTGVMTTAGLDFKIAECLMATATASYTANNTTQETWHGENSFYAARLRLPASGTGEDRNAMPYGGELMYQNTEHSAYTVRAQLNFSQALDHAKRHMVTASAGSEISSTQYYGLEQTYRGYLKERGRKMVAVDPALYPKFAEWQNTDARALGVWTDKLTNKVSGYATASYTYNNLYSVNANMRFDLSNHFGSRANDRFTPVWSVSGRWNAKEDLLRDVRAVSSLDIKGSFGYQGNMPDDISSKMILKRNSIDPDFQDYESEVLTYANPDLRWERTSSYNVTLDFGLLRNRLAGSVSYYYKKTHDAFLDKAVSSINGQSDWTVNAGVLENQGVEIDLRITLVDTRHRNPNGFRWSMNTSFGRMTNNVAGDYKNKTLTNQIDYKDYLDGTAQIQGRAMNSFYSYRYMHLDPFTGAPVLYGVKGTAYVDNQLVDLKEKYRNMEKTDIFSDVMVYSGTRVPTLQGGIQHSIALGRFSASVNTTYSFGSKIRLLRMYPNVNSEYETIAPQPTANVRREFLNRWRNPGDELHTNVPGAVSGDVFSGSLDNSMWWSGVSNMNGELIKFADNVWTMYDKSDLRVVSGSFLKIQSLSVRYSFTEKFCERISMKSAYVALSGTNLYTFCSSELKGQDPATQDGTAPTINMSLRPTYSFTLNVSF